MLKSFQNKMFYCVATILSCIVSVLGVLIIFRDELLLFFLMISIFIRFIALILAFCFFQKKLNEKRFRFLFIYSDAIVCALIIFSLCVLLAGKIPTNILDFHIISPSIVLILINLLCYLALHIGSKYIKTNF